MAAFIMGIIFGAIALVLAVLKGRSPAWFFAGFFFNIFGVLAVLILPSAIGFRQTTYTTQTAQTQPQERSEDYVPPSIQKDDYKSNSVDVGYEIVEDDEE